MTYDEFVREYNGKSVDYDRTDIGVQCVDLAKLYMDKVLNVKIGAIGNAEAYWRRYDELPILHNNFTRAAGIPQKGDIIVWGTGLSQYGHIAIATGDGDLQKFTSYDQNWTIKPMHLVEHSYHAVNGFLRPKNQSNIRDIKLDLTDVFDVDLYYWKYEDLRKNVGSDYNNLYNHYKNFGISEGRQASYLFDPIYYYNKYPDLQKAIGRNWKKLYEHYMSFGIKERRQASIVFDPIYYADHNIDVKNAYKSTDDLIRHFVQFGIKEFRLTSKEFNVRNYKTNYKDLQNAFKNDSKAYYKHYILFGEKEKRKC